MPSAQFAQPEIALRPWPPSGWSYRTTFPTSSAKALAQIPVRDILYIFSLITETNMTTKTFKSKRRSTGFTLIEMSVVVGLVAIAITAVTTRWVLIRDSMKAKNEVANMSTMVGKIRDVFIGLETYKALTNTFLIPMPKVIPDSMLKDEGGGVMKVVNAWGGAVTIKSTPDPFLKIQISYAEVTSSGCMSLVAGSAYLADSIVIGTDELKVSGAATASVDVIADKCKQAPTTPLVLTFS
jgi:prepilin-type N-terminal cleavage/methylation domain-containing protein